MATDPPRDKRSAKGASLSKESYGSWQRFVGGLQIRGRGWSVSGREDADIWIGDTNLSGFSARSEQVTPEITVSAVFPIKNPAAPVRQTVPMTIKSASISSATLRIIDAGDPCCRWR